MADLQRRVCKLWGINKTFATPHHPQTVDQVENLNKTLLSVLSKLARKDPLDWDLQLPYAVFAIRNTVQLATQDSPYHALYGRDAVLPQHMLLLPLQYTEDNPLACDHQKRMKEAWDFAREHLLVA